MAWSVKQHAAEIARKSTGELQKAIAVHDFVAWTVELFSVGQFVAPRRVFEFIFFGSFSQVSRIPFGLTAAFDAATAAETVMYQRGHCNPKGRLNEIGQRTMPIPEAGSLCRCVANWVWKRSNIGPLELNPGMRVVFCKVNIDNQVLHGCAASGF